MISQSLKSLELSKWCKNYEKSNQRIRLNMGRELLPQLRYCYRVLERINYIWWLQFTHWHRDLEKREKHTRRPLCTLRDRSHTSELVYQIFLCLKLTSFGFSKFIQNPMHANKKWYHTKFEVLDSMEPLKISSEIVLDYMWGAHI